MLCILDGWGYREEPENNAIKLAETPNYDDIWSTGPHALIETSGTAVGLPEGQMGNSEVGHMNIGGGRVVMQDLPRIDAAFAAGDLAANPVFIGMIDALKSSEGACHIMGLVSPGGVHSHQDQMIHLGQALRQAGVAVVYHAFLDGRDTPPKSAADFLPEFAAAAHHQGSSIGTIAGRYYAMDRDQRWERVEVAYRALAEGNGLAASDSASALDNAYERGETDEFVMPTVIGDFAGIRDGDGILMANFRADRAREILTTLVDAAFDGFERGPAPKLSASVGMVAYSSELSRFMPALFAPEIVADGLGETISRAGLKQLRIAETEKYAHVTFFLNGGEEQVLEGEDRILVPSPKVATYDLQPEMSAHEVTDKLVGAIEGGTYDLIIVNYANPDMVGHTGILPAAIKAVETIDVCLGRLREAIGTAGGAMLITADHGNIEMMQDPETSQPHTAHTVGKVPALLVGGGGRALRDGRLADIAPTILELMQLPQPTAMTGKSLLQECAIEDAREQDAHAIG